MNTTPEQLKNINKSKLQGACMNGDLALVKYLLESPEVNVFFDANAAHTAVTTASWTGELEILRYLLTSKELKPPVDFDSVNEAALRCACSTGQLEVVKYLLISPELEKHCDIHVAEDIGVRLACSEGSLNVVKYLLTSPDLAEHADIHASDDMGFEWACKNNQDEIIKYLIFEYKIEKTQNIINFLDKHPNPRVEKYFSTRDAYNELKEEISSTNSNVNTKKNKI